VTASDIALAVGWFIPGFALYAFLCATGALVDKVTEVNVATAPVAMALVCGHLFSMFMEPFSSWVAVGFGGVEDEDGLHDRGGPARAAAQLDQDLPALEGRHGTFANAADAGVGSVDGFLPA
jgi:hypothetical protein